MLAILFRKTAPTRKEPIKIAFVKFRKTVASMAMEKAIMFVLKRLPNLRLIASHSMVRMAVTINTPAKADNGIFLINEARNNMASNKMIEWMMLTSRVCAPERIATLVRIMAEVVGIPPKKGSAMFPSPCPINC